MPELFVSGGVKFRKIRQVSFPLSALMFDLLKTAADSANHWVLRQTRTEVKISALI